MREPASNEDAIQIIQSEGLGYAVYDYCSGSRFADPRTVKLWDEARAALQALGDYLEECTGLEIED